MTNLRLTVSTIRTSKAWPATSRCPRRGGVKGWLGLAEEVSDISLACRQVGPIRFKAKFEQGDDMFRQRRSLFFKKMQIVRGCDVKRNVLVYMVYSDRIIEGSPKNSTSSGSDHAVGRSRQHPEVRGFRERLRPLPFLFDAFSSREPVPTSLENAMASHHL